MKSKVALFVNGWNGENVDSFLEGFNNYLINSSIDIFVFTSYALTVHTQAMIDSENKIYDLPDISFFDVAVIYGSGFNSDELESQIINRCKEAGVPVILQGAEIEGVSTVTVDNCVGMRELCDHIIVEHNVKDIVFFAGPKDNADSNFRLGVLKDALEDHNLSLSDDDVFYADWEANPIQLYLMEHYGDKKTKLPDAFVCANDHMALFVILFLGMMGFRVPEDTIVTGFDNLKNGKVCNPSLTTVDQSYEKQGFNCAKLVAEALVDRNLMKKIVIPSSAVLGESCGCKDSNGENELRKQIGIVWLGEQYNTDSLQDREAQLDMCFMANPDFDHVNQSVSSDFLATVGPETEDFHVYVNPQYKDLEYMDISEEEPAKTGLGPVMDVICARTGGVIHHETSMNINKLLLGYGEADVGKTYVFKTLRVDNSVAGYMVMGYKPGAFKRREFFDFANALSNTLKKYQRIIDDLIKANRIQEQANEFLTQTVDALATAVDAKDSYTNGHSHRVAKYSRMIAEAAGLSQKECDDVYLAGLLHDVGKIGIDDSIINKKGKLTDEEFAEIKRHPGLGGQILSKIVMSPLLSIGARNHHERYDGRGYPDRLKGDEIPRIARIIAVADAYDAMTSVRSYRNIIPRMYVREELVKGIGSQFDPEYARIMISLLDKDDVYAMKESRTTEVFGRDHSFKFEEYKSNVTAGIRVTDCPVSVKLKYTPLKNGGQPTVVLYDSADARYYLKDSLEAGEMDFVEFASVDVTGSIYPDYARKFTHNVIGGMKDSKIEKGNTYEVNLFIVKQEDHVMLKITTGDHTEEMVFALYDAARYLYLALTGEYCIMNITDVDVAENIVAKGYIPRIAEKIGYIDGPVGDIPNVQIDSWITDRTRTLELDGDVSVKFHALSLPSSRRVWHCPIVALFTSDDGRIGGANFKELAFVRHDGEVWCNESDIINKTEITVRDNFENWSIWKQKNKSGVDCKMTISRKDNTIELKTENSGLEIKNVTTIPEGVSKVYFYITGDQCALTDIHINRG